MKILVFVLSLVILTQAIETPCRVADTNSMISEVGNYLFNGISTFLGQNTDRCVFYELHTLDHPPVTVVNASELNRTDFRPEQLTMFIVHGYKQSRNSESIKNIALTALKNHKINVFIVDWSSFSVNFYSYSRNDVRLVGGIIAEFINKIQAIYNLTGSSFLLVGHSLGSHVVGNAGFYVKSKVDRIVALDAAGPQFVLDSKDRLNPSHAEYVEVIHTDVGRMGIEVAIGHADYFPNGGISEKGCLKHLLSINDIFGSCEHGKSVEYFAESLIKESKFEAVQCGNYEDFLRGNCKNNTRSVMGGLIKAERPSGSFYLETGKTAPFSKIDAETKTTSVEEKIRDYQNREKLAGIFLNKLMNLVRSFFNLIGS